MVGIFIVLSLDWRVSAGNQRAPVLLIALCRGIGDDSRSPPHDSGHFASLASLEMRQKRDRCCGERFIGPMYQAGGRAAAYGSKKGWRARAESDIGSGGRSNAPLRSAQRRRLGRWRVLRETRVIVWKWASTEVQMTQQPSMRPSCRLPDAPFIAIAFRVRSCETVFVVAGVDE